MSERIAFLSLGVMGRLMAGHLARAGHVVTVYNRSSEKAAHFAAEHGCRAAASAAVAALVDQLYAEVQAMGGGRWDTSSLVARLAAQRAK